MKQDTILTKVIVGLMLAVLVSYMVLSGMKTMSNPYKLVVAYNDIVEDSVTLPAWAFRQEERLNSANGLISYRIDEGEKAAAGQVVAISYSNQEALAQQQRVRTVNSQYAQLQYAMSNDAPSGKSLDSQILSSVVKLQSAASQGDYTQLVSQADMHKKLILRREYLTSDAAAAELGKTSLTLGQEISNMQDNSRKDAQTIYAPQSGVFSSYVDGYETVYKPELLEEISPEQFRTLVAQAPQSNDGSVGKVVTDSEWYLALVVKEDKLPLFQKQKSVSMRSTSMPESVPMNIINVGYVQDGEAVVVLSSRSHLPEVMDLRDQAVSIIFRSEQGIRLPKTALRVQEDGSAGVYTVAGYRAEFKPVTVVAEDKSDYIVKANPKDTNDKRILRSGDEVVISTSELYEGKVVR